MKSDGCFITVPLGLEAVVYVPVTTVEKDKSSQIFISFTEGDSPVIVKRLLYTIFDNFIVPSALNAVMNLPEKSDIQILSNNLVAGPAIITGVFQILFRKSTPLQYVSN